MTQETKKEIDALIKEGEKAFIVASECSTVETMNAGVNNSSNSYLKAIALMMREQMREREARNKHAEDLIDKYKLDED